MCADNKGVTTDQREVFCINEIDFQIDLPDVGSWVIVHVTHIFSPRHVCVTFPYGTKAYSDLLACGANDADGSV